MNAHTYNNALYAIIDAYNADADADAARDADIDAYANDADIDALYTIIDTLDAARDVRTMNAHAQHRIESLVQQARGLSSGTMATLIGSSKYADIDLAQNDFVSWCTEHGGEYLAWPMAWHAWKAERMYIAAPQIVEIPVTIDRPQVR